LAEYHLFRELHPSAKVLAVPAPGGAARELAVRLRSLSAEQLESVDFAQMFWRELEISPNETREGITSR